MTGKVFSINISSKKGEPKAMRSAGLFKENFGLEGDAHAGDGLRQVSLLAIEDIEKIERASINAEIDFRPGLFAENITTEWLDLLKLKIGDRLLIGESVILRVTQIGKVCHSGCSILKAIGNCIMPKQGIFAIVEKGGWSRAGDSIHIEGAKKGIFDHDRKHKRLFITGIRSKI